MARPRAAVGKQMGRYGVFPAGGWGIVVTADREVGEASVLVAVRGVWIVFVSVPFSGREGWQGVPRRAGNRGHSGLGSVCCRSIGCGSALFHMLHVHRLRALSLSLSLPPPPPF